jgi:hypothetical protein
MGRLAIYDLKSAALIVCDIPIKDNFVSLEIESPEQFTVVKAADGSLTRCPTGDSEYKLKLTLVSSSTHTSALSALHALDAAKPGGAGVGAFSYVDGSGSTALGASSCWINKAPNRKIGAAVSEETWEITAFSDPTKMLFGGNSIT